MMLRDAWDFAGGLCAPLAVGKADARAHEHKHG